MRNQLVDFLTEWPAWAEAGAPDHPVFKKRWGLCPNGDVWALDRCCDVEAMRYELFKALDWQMFPFNSSYVDYQDEEDKTKNPARVEWVRNYLKDNTNE